MLENRSRDYVEHRVRAGVLEQGTVELLREAGVGERMDRDGIVHHGIHLQFDGERHHIALSELTDGRSIMIYGQHEVVKDLVAARLESGLPLLFDVDDVSVHDLDATPRVRFAHDGAPQELECDVDRRLRRLPRRLPASIPGDVLRTFEREYPFGWLGHPRASAPPSIDELVYAHHERGFALLSLRSPELSRYYLQCRPDEDLGAWPDERIWDELQLRTAHRRLDAPRGADPREGRHGDAQLRRRADAVRPPLPCRRRGAHRPADRREGPEPRGLRRPHPRARRSSTGTAAAARPGSTATRTRACAGSGAPSTSRGG